MKLFSYLLEANLCLIVFFGFFFLILRRETFFRFNRWYLLGSSILSFVIPLIKLDAFKATVIRGGAENMMIQLNEVVISSSEKAEDFSLFVWLKGTTVNQYLLIIYWVGVVVILIRVVSNLWKLSQIINHSSVIAHDNYKEVVLKDNNEAFSFMNFLFMGPSTSECIYKHELAHIRQKHSIDTLLIEIISAICWFNPIIHLYKIALKTVHELLADAEACQETSKYEYAELMINNVFRISGNQLIHTFNTAHTLKTRLLMLQKNKSSNWALLKYVLVLPLAGLLIFISSCMDNDNKAPEVEKPTTTTQAQKNISSKTNNTTAPTEPEIAKPTSTVQAKKNIPSKIKEDEIEKPTLTPTKEYTSTITTESTNSDNQIFYHVDENPEFPGGFDKISAFLGNNLRYPQVARDKGIQGRVTITFVVEKDGSIADVKVLRGIGYGCDEEAMRIVSMMPIWKPGKQDGKAVRVHFSLPIMFKLD